MNFQMKWMGKWDTNLRQWWWYLNGGPTQFCDWQRGWTTRVRAARRGWGVYTNISDQVTRLFTRIILWWWQLSLSLFWNVVIMKVPLRIILLQQTTTFKKKTWSIWSYASFYDGAKHHHLCKLTLKLRKCHHLLCYNGLEGAMSYRCCKKTFC